MSNFIWGVVVGVIGTYVLYRLVPTVVQDGANFFGRVWNMVSSIWKKP